MVDPKKPLVLTEDMEIKETNWKDLVEEKPWTYEVSL